MITDVEHWQTVWSTKAPTDVSWFQQSTEP